MTSLVHHKQASTVYTYEIQLEKIHPISSSDIDIESSTKAVDLHTTADALESCTLLFANKVATVYYQIEEHDFDFSELQFYFSEWFQSANFPYNGPLKEFVIQRRSELGQLFIDKLLQICGVNESYPPANMTSFQKIIESLLAYEIDDLQKFSIVRLHLMSTPD